ncbi:MAG TPA: hypothetical protein VFZ66_16440 [Herpetosiphonaceae bacterium]
MAQLKPNHPNTIERIKAVRVGFSLDWWSVIAAGVLALLVISGLLPTISW